MFLCCTVLWQILQVHLCVTDLELMDPNSNYKKNKYSHLPLVAFGHADTFGCECQVFDIFTSETLTLPYTTDSQSETGTFVIMFQKEDNIIENHTDVCSDAESITCRKSNPNISFRNIILFSFINLLEQVIFLFQTWNNILYLPFLVGVASTSLHCCGRMRKYREGWMTYTFF